MSRTVVLAALCCFIVIFGFTNVPAYAVVSIPATSCTGFLAPGQKSKTKDGQIIASLPNEVAAELQFYIFDGGMLLGPRGWSCASSSSGFVGGLNIRPPDQMVQWQITENFVDGSGDSRTEANMDSYLNAYFPDEAKKEILAGYGPINTGALDKYDTDKLSYPSPFLVRYVTSAYHLGIGNDILEENWHWDGQNHLVKPVISLPIEGFMKLIPRSDDPPSQIDLFAVSLPKELSGLIPYITSYAEALN